MILSLSQFLTSIPQAITHCIEVAEVTNSARASVLSQLPSSVSKSLDKLIKSLNRKVPHCLCRHNYNMSNHITSKKKKRQKHL